MSELVMKYQQDAEYKDSGVEWLGEIPKNWEVVRLKYIAELSGNKVSGSENQYVGLENVESKTGKFKVTEGIVSEGVSNTFEKDNLLFGKLRPYLAKSWLASFSGICSSEFLVLNSQLVHPKFLKYMTLTDEFIEQVNSSTYGSKMPRASWDFIGLLRLPVMDYYVSETIANFLDHETAQIDTLIEKQQTLIQLLKEKRQAVISHAVTKGLNPDVPMKDSGVEWLGEVPEHWEVGRLKNVLRIRNGRDYKEVEVESGGYPVYGSGGIFKRSSDYLFDGESVLFGRKGTVDKPLLVSGKFWTVDTMFYSEASSNAKPNYIYHQALLFPFDQLSTNTALPSMTQENLLELGFVIPPFDEQEQICQYLSDKLKVFLNLVSKAEQAIQLMQERRTALISAAVTGKIDVRGWRVPD